MFKQPFNTLSQFVQMSLTLTDLPQEISSALLCVCAYTCSHMHRLMGELIGHRGHQVSVTWLSFS